MTSETAVAVEIDDTWSEWEAAELGVPWSLPERGAWEIMRVFEDIGNDTFNLHLSLGPSIGETPEDTGRVVADIVRALARKLAPICDMTPEEWENECRKAFNGEQRLFRGVDFPGETFSSWVMKGKPSQTEWVEKLNGSVGPIQ